MMQANNRDIAIYNVVISSLMGDFQLRTEVTKVDRGVLLSLGNPWYKDLLERYNYLKGVTMDDVDNEEELHALRGLSNHGLMRDVKLLPLLSHCALVRLFLENTDLE